LKLLTGPKGHNLKAQGSSGKAARFRTIKVVSRTVVRLISMRRRRERPEKSYVFSFLIQNFSGFLFRRVRLVGQSMSLNKTKGGCNALEKWVKTMVSDIDHRRLKLLAIDNGVSLTRLVREIIENFLHKEK